ncbi:MAG: ATP-binding protein, partial [Actinomycetota bacterium]
DLTRPERIYQLCHPDLPHDFPPLRTLDQAAHNLPVELTTFVGRDDEVAELRTLLKDNRLVTITGPGGMGKTRLAAHVAADTVDEFGDGIRIVYLAPLRDGESLPQAVAAAFGLREQAGRSVTDSLIDLFLDRRILLILDNCEHLADRCADFATTLLERSPLHVLGTSRAPLGIRGERVWQLQPLPLPDESIRPEDLAMVPSVRLLLDRATLAGAQIQTSAETAAAIVQACRTLAGMPLAIELAAARLRGIGIQQMSRRLQDEMLELTRATGAVGDKGRALEATLDWSHDLLSDAERALLRRTAIFAGGFTLVAAERVCGDDVNVLATLPALCDRSLVVYHQDADRYRLLEPIRQYAWAKLRASGEFEQTEERHFSWCLELTEASGGFGSPAKPEFMTLFETEHDNFRAALDGPIAQADPEKELRLAQGLQAFWNIRGHFDEGRRRLTRAIERAPAGDPRSLLSALVGLRRILRSSGDRRQLKELHVRAEDIAHSLGDRSLLATVEHVRALEMFADGQLDEAEPILVEVLRITRETGHPFMESRVLNTLGEMSRLRGDHSRAADRYSASVATATANGDPYMAAMASANLGSALVMLGNLEGATAPLLKAIEWSKEAPEPSTSGGVLTGLAAVLASTKPELAAHLLGSAEQARDDIGEVLLPVDRDFLEHVVGIVRGVLGNGYQAAFDRGRTIPLGEAVALAIAAQK